METSSHSSAALAAASLKEQKELFVSGLEGTTAFELLLICSTAVTGILFFQALSTTTKQSWLAEVAAFWIPMILCQTVWLYPYGVAYLIGQMAFALLIQLSRGPIPNNEHQPKGSKLLNSDQDLRRLAVTVYRSCLMFLTVTAILAVDFHVFPRRLGKTETTGYSLMDLGAASFVIAAGIVSPRARSSQQQQQQLSADWSKRIQRMIPLLLMGSLRLLTHKELEYQEHVSEYGVHWNFFYTLALLVPVSAVMSGRTPSWVQPVATMTFYQLLLTTAGLQAWVQDAPRSCPRKIRGRMTVAVLCEFWCANREGILGCISYAVLYLASEWIAYRCFWNPSLTTTTSNTAIITAAKASARLWLVVAALFVLWQVLLAAGLDVSRRTTNAVFCVWVLFVNMLQLAAIHFVIVFWNRGDTNENRHQPPAVLAAVNRHGLITFVIANLLTGAVNLSVNTLAVSDGVAVGILVVYLCTVGLVAVVVDRVWKYLVAHQKSALGERPSQSTTEQKSQATTEQKKRD